MNEELFKLIKDTEENVTKIAECIDELKRKNSKEIEKFGEAYGIDIDNTKLDEFFKEFYYIYPSNKKNEWMIAIPKFIPVSIGWFDSQKNGYNIYRVNNYTQWIGEIPEFMKKELGLRSEKDVLIDGDSITFPESRKESIEKEYGEMLSEVGKGRGKIKSGRTFDIISSIIEHGGLPFVPKEIDKKDLRIPKVNFKLEGKYKFQMDAFKIFLKYGAVGAYWMTGAGKSFFLMYSFDSLIGKKVLFIPNITLKEQWIEYFKTYAPRLVDEVEIYHYSRWDEVKDKKYVAVGFDECQFLPAPTYATLSTLNAKYRIGLSASPFREDGNENLIFALTGYPVGIGWKDLMGILGKRYHEVNVHIVNSESDKMTWLRKLFDPEKKTFISVFRLDMGRKIAKEFDLPFVSGETKNRMNTLRDNKAVVMSKVGELGISIKDLQHIIEPDFHFGSRQDELQLTGRILHGSNKNAVHDIIMTKYEYLHYGKRLNSLTDKGFFPKIIPHVNLYEEQKAYSERIKKAKKRKIKTRRFL